MNLQQIMRVVLCAALVALCVAGAGLFPAQPVAGQTADQSTLHGAAALDQLKRAGQYDSLQAAMNQARFSVSHTARTPLGRAAWRAPNPAAGYDAYVTEAGVSIIVKGAVNDESYVSLSLHSLGYGAALRAVGPGEVSGDKQTINLTRDNGVREWYVNGADGLEHGFTLSEPPPGARQQGAPLRLALLVSAGWRAVASDDGKLVTLRGANDQAVEYGKLVVRDKLGRNIPARLTVAGEQVVIEVEDYEAGYPLTIDPLFTLQQKLTAADGAANDYLGYAVALSGDTALVGAPYDDVTGMEQGSAYVFVRNGATQGATWTQQARLTAQDSASFDYFGWSVALDGDTALVGALYGPGSINSDQGAVYVFVRGGATWSQQARLNAGENTSGAQFGAAVALDGQTALIGAPTYTITPSFADIGVVYIFVRSGATPNTSWTQQARLNANDAGRGDRFGEAVALDGDTALVGAPKDDVGTNADQGSAYLLTRNGASWTQRQKLTTTDSAAGDQFGNAVALSGEKALIGAYLYGSDDRGAMFTFRRGAAGWAQTDGTRAPNPTAGAHFGVSVALSGDTAVVGASLGLFTQGVDQRSAYVFVFGGEWFPVRQLGPELGAANDGFGYAVALDGDTVLVGAYRGDATATDQGAAYAFVLHDNRHVEQQKLTANDGGAGDYFGKAVALSGDTLVVGAYLDNIGANQAQGSAYVFTRNGTTWTQQQKLTANDGAAEDYFGNAVALSGDTLVVGAYMDDIGGNGDQGSAYIFTRNGTVWAQQQKLTAVGNDGLARDNFGISVALSGDTVVVGASGVANYQGSAYVFKRSGAVWTQQEKLIAGDGEANDQLGFSVALSGDTVVVGAFADKIGANGAQGSAYVFTRSGTTWTPRQKLTAADGAANDFFGYSVALSGDTAVVGALFDTIGANSRQGSASVFTRSGAGWAQVQKLTAADGAAEDNFGSAVALSGDTVVVGARGNFLSTNNEQGSAYVYTYFGFWYPQQKLTAADGAVQDLFGFSVALSGDTVLVGASGDDIGSNSEQGSAYVFVSPACPALALAPASLPNGVLGAAYNQQFTASGGRVGEEFQFAVSSGALPFGLTLTRPGLLSGAPIVTGTYRFTITTTFLFSGCSGSRAYTISVTPPCPPITVEPEILPNGATGAAYSQTLTVMGGATPYNFVVATGALPAGLNLSNAGVLGGAPTQAGNFNFTLRITDANGCVETRAYSLTINPSCAAITVNPAALPNATVGAAYNQQLTATGGATPHTFSVSTGSLPTGLNLSSAGLLAGAPTQPGSFNFTVRATDANNCQGTRSYTLTINGGGGGTTGLQYYPLPHPIRLLDTRPGAGGCNTPGAPISGGGALTLQARAACDGVVIPADAQAVVGNATVVNFISGGGFITLFPNGAPQPTVSNLNYQSNQVIANAFTVGLGSDGEFKIFASSTTHFIVDLAGYYAPPGAVGSGGLYYHPLPSPIRLLDTRAGVSACTTPGAPLQGGAPLTQNARVSCNGATIPANAQAVVGNATVVNFRSGGGFITLWPTGASQPAVSNLNYQSNQIIPNAFTVALGAGGGFEIFASSTTDFIVDLTGYYSSDPRADANGAAGLLFNPLSHPIRLLDTRPGQPACDQPATPLQGGAARTQQARVSCDGATIPANAQAVVGNATVVNFLSGGGFITLWPNGATQPPVSNLNYLSNQIIPNAFTVSLGAGGGFNIFASSATHFIVDLTGFFAP